MSDNNREDIAYLSDVSRTPHDAIVGSLVEFGENGFLRNSSKVVPTRTSELSNDSGFLTSVDVSDFVNESDLDGLLDDMDVVRKNDLSAYVKTAEVMSILSGLVRFSELDESVSELGYAKSSILEYYVTISGLEAELGEYAKKTDIKDWVEPSELDDKLEDYSKKSDLLAYVKLEELDTAVSSLDKYATKQELEQYVDAEGLARALVGYVSIDDLPEKIEEAGFARSSDLERKRDISDTSFDGSRLWVLERPNGAVVSLEWDPDSSMWSGGGFDLSYSSGEWTLMQVGEHDLLCSGGEDDQSISFETLDVPPAKYTCVRGARLSLDTEIPTSVSQLSNDVGFITSASLPTKVSDLENDSGFITTASLPTKVSDFENDSGFITDESLPTKVSDLENDSGFITDESLPTKVSDLENDSGFITDESLPTKVSDLENDSGFITTASLPTKVSDLENDSGFVASSSLPTKVSDLTNDSGFITEGSLPTKVSDLENDSEFITEESLPTKVSDLENDEGYVIQDVVDHIYDTNESYSIGDTCTHGGKWYKCKSSTSGSWISSAWEEITIKGELSVSRQTNSPITPIVDPAPVISGSETTYKLTNGAVNVIRLSSSSVPDGNSVHLLQPDAETSDGSPVARIYTVVFISNLNVDLPIEIGGNIYDCIGNPVNSLKAYSGTGKSTSYRLTEYDRQYGRFIATGACDPALLATIEIDRALADILVDAGGFVPDVGVFVPDESGMYHKITAVTDPETNKVDIGIEQEGVIR